MVVEEAAMAITGVTDELTVIVIEFEMAVEGLAQLSDEVMVHSTTSLLESEPFVYAELFVPTLVPFSVH